MSHRHKQKSKQTGLLTFPSALHLVPWDHTPYRITLLDERPSQHGVSWVSTHCVYAALVLRTCYVLSPVPFVIRVSTMSLVMSEDIIFLFFCHLSGVFPANLLYINLLCAFGGFDIRPSNLSPLTPMLGIIPSLLWAKALRIKFCDSFASLTSLSKDL